MTEIRIVDVVDEASFGLVPPCADPGFDHRTCDYWEDAERGSKAARLSWLGSASERPRPRRAAAALFGDEEPEPAVNPFLAEAARRGPAVNPLLEEAAELDLAANPFAPPRPARPAIAAEAPRKLQLLGRGLGVFGSYAKVLLADGEPVAYAQFGPLSAYPRAQRLRELYPQLPQSPAPAVITCIATTAAARRRGFAKRLVAEVCRDLAGRGFAAVEAYPEVGARLDATSAATVDFWLDLGFEIAVDDPRFPVVRRTLE